ncbi:MAG: glycosyltransferase [Nitrospinae bacterium]|nr:glycosyltransferase [Nitrospinota bacterium]
MPAYNNEDTIIKSILSIANQKTGLKFEVIAVDDGSTDNTYTLAENFLNPPAPPFKTSPSPPSEGGDKGEVKGGYGGVKLIKKKNGGEASALNEGLKHCTGKFIAIVEADVEIEDRWIEKVIREFADAKVAGVGGRLVTPEKSSWIAKIAGYEIESKFETKERYANHITSANAVYRAEIFKEIGGFNENLVNAVLDSDLNRRIIEKGYKLIYTKEASALHHFKPTFNGYLKRQYSYARYRVHERLALYPADRFLALNVLICGMSALSILTIPFTLWLPAILLSLSIILQLPSTFKLINVKRDPILCLYPFVIIIRNVVSAFGYGIGIINKGLNRY